MPRYVYECGDCKENFEVYHSISEDWADCLVCKSQNIERVLYNPISFSTGKEEKPRKTGELVEEFIQESKEALNQDKKEAIEEEYKG